MYPDEEPFLVAEFKNVTVDNSLYHEDPKPKCEKPIELDGSLEADFTDRLLKEIPENYRLDVLSSGIIAQMGVESYNEFVRKTEESYK